MTNDIMNLSGVQDAREVAVGTFNNAVRIAGAAAD